MDIKYSKYHLLIRQAVKFKLQNENSRRMTNEDKLDTQHGLKDLYYIQMNFNNNKLRSCELLLSLFITFS